MKSFSKRGKIIFWSGLLGMFWLCCQTALAQSTKQDIDVENRETLRLTNGDEEARLAGLIELANIFKVVRRAPRPATVALLIQILRNDPSAVLRTHAARVLEYAAPSSATDALLTSLQAEPEIATRKAILYALAHYPSGAVTAAVIPFLQHKEVELRATAAYALAELADTASASALHECLIKKNKDEDVFTRAQAARAIGRIGYRPALPDLLKLLKKDLPYVQRFAAEALGWLANAQDLDVMNALGLAVKAEDPYLREAVQIALKRIAERAHS